MITDEELELIRLHWPSLLPAEKTAFAMEAERLRPLVADLPPFANITAESFRTNGQVSAGYMVEEDECAIAVEVANAKVLLDPKTRAWDNLIKHLLTVRSASDIAAATEAVLFAENMVEVLMDAVTIRGGLIASEVFDIFLPRPDTVAKAERSRMAAENARKKNIDPRAWVILEWSGRTRRNESKAAFARRYVSKIKERFGTTVSAEQIARKWLPKQGV
ncbi:MAG TPA: hypothetical protein VFY31_07200 [Macromonas sp.]|nr:hypothetical protein [Macromonas sp.]